VSDDAHLPIRPTWTCGACGIDWPCPTRRCQLLAEYQRAHVSLALLMVAYFAEATQDLGLQSGGELYARFLGWLHGSPPPE
jgi:hypothetical protein